MENGLTPEVKLALLQREVAEWQQLRYTLEVRHRVNKRIGASPDAIEAIAKDLERCEKALDALREIESELKKGEA